AGRAGTARPVRRVDARLGDELVLGLHDHVVGPVHGEPLPAGGAGTIGATLHRSVAVGVGARRRRGADVRPSAAEPGQWAGDLAVVRGDARPGGLAGPVLAGDDGRRGVGHDTRWVRHLVPRNPGRVRRLARVAALGRGPAAGLGRAGPAARAVRA